MRLVGLPMENAHVLFLHSCEANERDMTGNDKQLWVAEATMYAAASDSRRTKFSLALSNLWITSSIF